MFRSAPRVLLAIALGLVPVRASADLYRWVDELGVTHFTTDRDTIPRRYRGDAEPIGELPKPTRAPIPRAAAPAPSPSPEPVPETAAPLLPEAVAPAQSTPELAEPASTEPTVVTSPTVFPGPPSSPELSPDDPRASEVAQLEAQIASDREKLRQMISTKRWDSAELASDPEIREIAERLPRLQAQLAALQAEPAP